ADNKEVLTLLVGAASKQKKDDKRLYARLASGQTVFLLDAIQSEKALAEYRKRKVWDGLDAAQVESIAYSYGKNSFTRRKVDKAWQVAGQPEAKVKTEAVTATLDALARLEVERYAVDKGAMLQLYGLQPPVLVVDVQTPTGKRTLHIGNRVGAS